VKKELYLPLVLIGLSAAFIAVSFLVWITSGNDSLLKKKLRIGALIISLSGIALGCWSERDCSTCYLVAQENQFIVEDQHMGGRIVLEMSVTNKLTGMVDNYTSDNFWYLIEDYNDNEIQRGTVDPLDGAFDEYSEEFEIPVRIDLATGEYKLEFYLLEEEYPLATYELYVIND
jgi:hypothetical protein